MVKIIFAKHILKEEILLKFESNLVMGPLPNFGKKNIHMLINPIMFHILKKKKKKKSYNVSKKTQKGNFDKKNPNIKIEIGP